MNTLKTGHTLKLSGAALAACIVLAACGGGGSGSSTGPSALDPANMVPASAVAYVSVAVKPQGSMRSDLIEAIDSIAGQHAAQHLSMRLDKSLGKKWHEVLQNWAGQRLGIGLTSVPATRADLRTIENDLVFVFPTSNPAAAKRFLAKTIHKSWETWDVVGHYALVGGKSAVAQAKVTTTKTSLAGDTDFRADMARLGSDELFTVYAPLHQLLMAVAPLLKSDPAFTASDLAEVDKEAPAGSSVALGGATLHNQFRLDVISHGTHTKISSSAKSAGVSSLPAGSWLALSLGGSLTQSSAVNMLATELPQDLARIQALSGRSAALPSGPLQFIEKDLLPALGPMSLSVTGSSLPTLQAGLLISPLDRSAGARLASGVRRLVKGLPISATTSGGHVAVTYGYSSLQQLLKPTATLGQSIGFKSALSQLPAGSRASVYVDFAPIAALASLDSGANGPSALRVLRRLDYLVAGGTRSHFRLVLATN